MYIQFLETTVQSQLPLQMNPTTTTTKLPVAVVDRSTTFNYKQLIFFKQPL